MKKITPPALKDWLNNDEPFILIDVRESWEREIYNIGGTHIPLAEVMLRRNEIPVDVATIVYCEKGIRSAIIIQRLEAIGFNNLYNLEGGMSEWKRAMTVAIA